MGTFIGHVAPGAAFCLIGLWHLYNTIRNYAEKPWEFESRSWFPARFRGGFKYLELYAIIAGSCLSIAGELHFGLHGRPVLDEDWSIPWMNLNNFEHSSISLFFLMFATMALLLDSFRVTIPFGLLHIMGAIAFSQELLIFHLHSADHMGLEGQYHWLLQLILIVSIACVLLEIAYPHSVLIPIIRSMSILFQGCWFIQMGYIIFTRVFVPKGCKFEEYRVLCEDTEAQTRAKALATLQFSWWLAGMVAFTVIFHVCVTNVYGKTLRYEVLEEEASRNDLSRDVEMGSRSMMKSHGRSRSNSMEELPAVEFGR